MSEITGFLRLGVEHILDWNALDHLLFLLILAAPYRAASWRRLLLVATAFTAGHSVTLALTMTGAVRMPPSLVEFLIPVTIVLAGAVTVRRRGRTPDGWGRPLLAGGFGLIHGAGFAGYLRDLLGGPVARPLLGFNLGVELGQVLVLVLVVLGSSAADRVLGRWRSEPAPARAVLISAAAGAWALVMAAGRLPV